MVTGAVAEAGVRLAEGGAIGTFGIAPTAGRLTPGMTAEAALPAVGASGISVASAGRMRWASDAVLNSLRATTGLGASCTCSSAGLGLAGVGVATGVAGVVGTAGVLAFLVGGGTTVLASACWVSSGDCLVRRTRTASLAVLDWSLPMT